MHIVYRCGTRVQSVCCWWKGERSQTFFLLPSRRSRSVASLPSSLVFYLITLLNTFWMLFLNVSKGHIIYYTCVYHTCIDSKEHFEKEQIEKNILKTYRNKFRLHIYYVYFDQQDQLSNTSWSTHTYIHIYIKNISK